MERRRRFFTIKGIMHMKANMAERQILGVSMVVVSAKMEWPKTELGFPNRADGNPTASYRRASTSLIECPRMTCRPDL